MDVEKRDIGIWHESVETAARRQSAIKRWHAHAKALHCIGLLDEVELREMLDNADAACVDVSEY